MKKRTYLFIVIVIVGLLSVPLINLVLSVEKQQRLQINKSSLFNLDFASQILNQWLYQFGISMDPSNIIIGYDGWLYLGNAHSNIQTVSRKGITPSEVEEIRDINYASREWERWLKSQGVKLFKVMVAPNKGSVFPEHLPKWATPAPQRVLDDYFGVVDNSRFIDLRKPLFHAKNSYKNPIYYQTDTHWNPLGAGLAFEYFVNTIRAEAPELAWLPDNMYEVAEVFPRAAGDLAMFLRIESSLPETEVVINAYHYPTTITQYDFTSGEKVYNGANTQLFAPHTPQKIVSDNALNQAKVLWVRDSFGNAMSPLMAATFSETLQIHYAKAFEPSDVFVHLVSQFKPDYVFFTVVERDVRQPLFAHLPPDSLALDRTITLSGPQETLSLSGFHHLEKTPSPYEYQINGEDPYWEFVSDFKVTETSESYMKVSFSCKNPNSEIPIQLFWLEDGMNHYSEEKSAHATLISGTNLISLNQARGLSRNKTISKVRLDINQQSACQTIKLEPLVVGSK